MKFAMNGEQKGFNLNENRFEQIVIDAFCSLEVSKFDKIDDSYMYNDCNKELFIDDMKRLFKYYRGEGLKKLTFQKSKCLYCYPDSKTYKFINSETNEFVFRYVIHKEKDGEYIIQECENMIIPDGENGRQF